MADEPSSASSAFSPLSGGYLLIVLSEPHSEQHKQVLLEHLAKGLASWDSVGTQIDIESELRNIATQCPNGEEVRNGEKLIQLASDSLVTEILIQPQLSTLKQCMRNLLASFTRHRHVIHAGYTLSGPGSWILQDGTYEFGDFQHIVQDPEIQRLYRAYESSITMDLHCADEGQWSAEQINQEPAIKAAKISVNPPGRLSATESQSQQDAVNSFIRYISDILPSVTLDHLLEPSDVVGNIRFNHPTLYVFPGGQGDSALFGISGFNILVDGGFGRKPCFWDFTRHLDRLDAVVMTRSNASSLSGLTGAICRKASSPVYPQMGHIFCNLPRDGEVDLNDIDQQINAADSTSESLTVNINDLCRAMSAGLGALQLKAQPIYRSATLEPINLYHKVGHGTLDMFIISPSANSPEVKELMRLWRSGDVSSAFRTVKMGGKEFRIPLLDIVSVCALLVWQPADPNEAVTRLLFPGSAPQHKILEGLEKFKQLEFLKSPVFMAKDVAPPPSAVITPSSTSSAFTKSPVKTKSTSSPRHTPIEPVPVKASATVRKEVSSKPPPKASDHSGSNANSKETDAKPRPATKIIKADVLSSSSRTGSAELRAKKAEAKPTTTAPIKSTTTSSTTTTKKETTGMSVNGETNKPLVPKIKKDVANMKMVEARVHSFKSPASLKRAEESTKNKKPADDKDIKDKVQRSQSQSREKRSASSVRGQPADEEKTRVKLVKKIEATPASPAKTTMTKNIKAKPKETSKTAESSKAAPIAKEPLKKDKPTTTAAKAKPSAPKESAKPASKATPAPPSSSTPSGKAVKRPVKAAAAAAAAIGAAATVVAVASVTSEQPTEEQPVVVEEDFSATEAPQAASSPKHEAPSAEDEQVPDETSNIIEAIESQILEDVEAVEQQSQHESEPETGNVEDETEEKEEEEQEEEQGEGSVAADVADAEEAEEGVEKDDEEVIEVEEEEIAQVEDGDDEGAGSEEVEVADAAVPEEVVQTEDAEADAEGEDAEAAGTDEVPEVVEEVAEEVTEEAKEEVKEEKVDDEEEEEEVAGPETAELEEAEEKSNKDAEEIDDKEPEHEEKEIDVEENEKQERDDDVVDVQDEEIANEPEVKSIDDEVAVDVAQVDRSNDQDDNLETDECREPVEEEEIQPAVSSTSVDAGRPKSASPQPVVSGDETANVGDDTIDQSEQSHNLDAVQQDIQNEESQAEELEKSKEDKDVEDKEESVTTEQHHHEEIPAISPEPVEEEIQPAVASKPVETVSKPTSASPLPHEDNQGEDLQEDLEDVDREKEVEEEKEINQEESSIEYQTIDKELDEEDYKHPVAISCQLFGPGKDETAEEIQPEESDNLIHENVDSDEEQVDDVDQHVDGQHDIEKRQTQELTVENAGHHQEDALSSLSSLSDLEPTPVLDRSGASLYEEEQQLSSMESQPESHQFTQKSAPRMEEASPKESVQQTIKSSLAVVDDESSGPSSVEVEEEFKAEIVVRPVPISVPLGVIDFVPPHEPTPIPPVVKSPVKDVPTPLVLDQEEEEDDGVEVEEEAFHQEIKNKDSAVPITPVEEDQGAQSFNYDEPQRQSEDHRQLPSSLPADSDVTSKKEESTVDGSTASLSLSKEVEADEFRATIDKQYAGFMNTPTGFTEEKSKTPEEKPSTETVVEKKMAEEKCTAEPVIEKKTPEPEKTPSPLEAKDHCAAVGDKKSDEAKKTDSSDVKPAEIVEEPEEETPIVEEVVSKVVDNKSVKAEKMEESIVKDIAKSPETKPLMDESDIVKMIVGDIVAEKVEISTTDDKSVKVSLDLESEVVKASEHMVESFQAVDSESTQSTKEADSPKSHESFVEQVKSLVEDVKSSLVEDVQVSKMDIKPVESEKKDKVLLEESKEVFKKEELSIAVHAEAHSNEDVEKKEAKDSVPDVPIQTTDNKSIKVDADVVEPTKLVSENEKSLVEEAIQKVSIDVVEKVGECLAKEKELFGKAVEDEEESVPVFEKCEKYGKTEKENVLSDVIEPIQQSTAGTVVLSAEVKSQRSSTSEAAPVELEFDIPERKYSDISVSSTTSLEKDAIVDAVVSEIKAAISESEMKPVISESEMKSAASEPITGTVDPVFVAPITASSPIDGPELLKELTFPQGLPSKSETVSSPKSLVEEIKETIQDVKEVALDFLATKPEVDTLSKDKIEDVKQILTDVKETSKPELDCSSKSQVEEIKEIIHADVKATLESASKSETVCHYESQVEEARETVPDVRKASLEMKFDADLPKSQIAAQVEEVKEIISEVRKASLEMTPQFEADLHKTQVEDIKEIIQDVKKTNESAPKCESVQETLVQQVKETSFESATTSETELSPKSKVEEVKEVVEDVKKAFSDLASKQETDHSHHVEEVKEIIHDVKETSTSAASKIDQVLESLPKLEAKVEVKSVTPEPEVIPQATFQLKCDPLANLPVVELFETPKNAEQVKPKSADLPIQLDVVDKTDQLKPDTIDCSNVSGSSSASVTPKTPLSPNIARREVVECKAVSSAANYESFSAPPPSRFEDDVRDSSQPSSLDSMEVHSNSSTSWAGAEKQHYEDEEEEEDVAAMSLTPTVNYLAAGYEGVNISTTSKLSTIASSDGEADGAQPPSLDSNWSSKTFDKLTLAAESSARHQPEESAFSSGPSSWDDREPGARPYYVVSESISDRSATSSIISHATDDDYPAEKLDRPSLVSHVEPLCASSELNIKKELDVAPVSPVPSSPFSTDRCSSHGDFEANKDSLSSIQTSESSDYHLETKVDDSASAISSTRSDYSDDRSGSSIDPSLLQQQRLEQRSLTPRSDISCSSETTEPVTTANTTTTTNTTQLIQPGQQQTSVELKASSKAELADPKLAPHNIWLKEKDTASSPNPFTDQYADDDTDHSEPLASSTLYYQQQQQQPVQHLQQQHLSDFESDRHSDSQSSSVPVAEYTDEYYVQHLDYVETSQKSSHPHADEVSDQEAYLYESEHDDPDHHYHPYSTKYSDSYDEADLYPTEEAINDDYRHIGDHQNGNSYHYYESGESATTDVAHDVVGNLHGQYEDLNRNDRTPTRDAQQHPYAIAPDVYETEPSVISPTSRQLDVTTAATTSPSSSRDERVLPQTSSLPSPQSQLSPQQQQQQQHEDTLASWGKPLGLPAPVAPGVVFSSNGSNGSPLKRPATATNNGHKASDKATNGANNAASSSTPFYVDLAYIPHHSDPRYSDVDFFKRIRARHYVLSTLEPSAQVLDALLEGKQSWTGDDKDLDVTIIPTYDSDALATWVSANEDLLARNRIDLAPSASRCTINLQDHETSCSAYRLEF